VRVHQEERLKRIRSELQAAYTLLEHIETSNNLARNKLDLWRAKCKLELAILMIKILSGIDEEERRARYSVEGEPQKVLAKALELIANASNSILTTNPHDVLEKVRRARDLLWLLESKNL